jgi:hypothetical protein
MAYKLGKRPAKRDARNIKLKSVLKVLPPPPDTFDVDQNLPAPVPTPMYANDRYGCCVISGRAHHTLRYESREQGLVVPITDDEVLQEYWKEGQRGCFLIRWLMPRPDNGLVLLDSLKAWRNDGWTAGGKFYKIYAFAEIDRDEAGVLDLKQSVYLLHGANAGVMLPQSAIDQFQAGEPWTVVPKPGSIVGGHDIAIVAYSPLGPLCVTWGKRQPMSWEFYKKYVDECYAIVDNRDPFLPNSPIDVEKLNAYLKEIAG